MRSDNAAVRHCSGNAVVKNLMEFCSVHLTAGYLSATLLIWDEGLWLLRGQMSQADG